MTRRTLTRVTAPIGLAGVGIIALGMILAGFAYGGTLGQEYRIANHFVSELGEVGVSRLAWAFNVGLMLGGAALVVFVLGLTARLQGWFRWIVGAAGVATGIFGGLVGVFPMNNLAAHIVVANGYFYPGLATMVLFSGYALWSRHNDLPRWTAIPGLVAAAALVAFLFLSETIDNAVNAGGPPPDFGANRPDLWVMALSEWIAIGSILTWVLVIAAIFTIRDRLSEE